jgi:capsular exopolysaccharide synthesis family protein
MIGMCCAGAVVLAALYLLVAPRTYRGQARIYVQSSGPRIMGDGKQQLVDTSGQNFLATQREVLLSTPTLAAALEKLNEGEKVKSFEGVTDRFDYLKQNLDVKQGKGDDLLAIGFEAGDPDDAARIANAVVVAYMSRHARQKEATAGDVLVILKREKEEVEKGLSDKTKEMLDYRRAKGVLSYSTEDKGNVALQQLKSVSDAMTQAHLDTFSARSAYEEAFNSLASDPAKIAMLEREEKGGGTAVGSAEESQLRLDLLQWRARLASARQSYLPNHPTVQSIQKHVDALDVAYVAALGRRYESAELREAELRESFAKQQADAIGRSADAAQYDRMEAEVKRLERLSETIGSRIKEIQLTEASGSMNITPVEWAAPAPRSYSPKAWPTLAVALLAGLMSGVVLACVRDWRDPHLRTAEEVKAVLGLPVLGQTPRIEARLAPVPTLRGRQVLLEPGSAMAEACRGLRTALHYGLREGKSKTILMTSPSPRDGKSTLTSNLAIAMAQMGKKVLLVDADLRRPVQHEAFGISSNVGLSTLLAGGQAMPEVAAFVQPTGVEGLHLLPAGPVPENPAELLNSPRFVALMAKLAEAYDHVLIDSPPVGAVVDARIMAASCDATVLVLNADHIDRAAAEATRDALAGVGANIVGLVLNGVSPGSPFYSGEYQAYYGKDQGPRNGSVRRSAGGFAAFAARALAGSGTGRARPRGNGKAALRPGAGAALGEAFDDGAPAALPPGQAAIDPARSDVIVDGLGRSLSRSVLFEAMRAALRERRMPFRRRD